MREFDHQPIRFRRSLDVPTASVSPLRPSLAKAAVMIADAMTVGASMLVAYRIWMALTQRPHDAEAAVHHAVVGMIAAPLWIVLFRHYQLYSARHVVSRIGEFRRVVHGCVAGGLATAVVGVAVHVPVTRGWLVLSAAIAVILISWERAVMRRCFAAVRRSGRMLRPVVIVGGNLEGVALCGMLARERSLGYRVVGFVDDQLPLGERPCDDRPVLGRINQTLTIVQELGACGVVVATTSIDVGTSNRLARELTDAGIHVEMSSSLRDIAADRLTVHGLGQFPMVYVTPVSRSGWRPRAKRALDIGLSLIGLLLLSPLLAVIALAIRLGSPGGTLFHQERIGRNGESFRVTKFRTMVAGAEHLLGELRNRNEADGPLFKIREDPRVTRVGRLLRKYSLDELPQLWNVLRGEMSLVGPRPALRSEMDGWTPEMHQRLRVKPGLTGMWQVGGRSNSSFEEYVRLDLYYVDNWSLLTDLLIVAKTVPAVLFGRGAF